MTPESKSLHPIASLKKFAEDVDMPLATVRTRVEKGELPVIRFGLDPDKNSPPYINVALLNKICLEQELNHPQLTRG